MSGLTHPKWIDEDQAGHLRPFWDWWEKEIKAIGPVDVAVLNGDLTHGPGKRGSSIEMIRSDTKTQADMAIAALSIIDAKVYRISEGTSFHVVSSYEMERPIAEHFHTTLEDTVRLQMNDLKLNFRHYVGSSRTAYAQGTPIYREVVQDLLKSVERGYDPADIYFRSHVHYHAYMGIYPRVGYTLPCLELPKSIYGTNVTHTYYHVGFLEFVVHPDSKWEVIPHIMKIKNALGEISYEQIGAKYSGTKRSRDKG